MREKTAGSLVEATSLVIWALPKFEMAMASHDATDTSVKAIRKIQKTRRSTPDSVALNPVSERSHSKETKMVHPVWPEY